MDKKKPFTAFTKMADVIHHDYKLIPIIGRFGIDYGFGNQTVADVCKSNEINTWFFLEIINSYHNENYFPQKQLQNFTAELIIKYLSNTHNYYLEVKVPEIHGYIDEMEKTVKPCNIKNIRLLNDFFRNYKEELEKHLEIEDKEIFPYTLQLEQAVSNKVYDKKMVEQIIANPIEKYERNHSSLEVKLSDLKNLIIKFLPPVLCKSLCQKLLTELFRLEADLANHSRIEEKVLVPKVKILQQKIMEASGEK